MNIRAIKNGSIKRHPIASITINLKVTTKGKKAVVWKQFCAGHVAGSRVWLCHSDRTVMTVRMIECLVCHSLIKRVSLRSDGWQGRAVLASWLLSIYVNLSIILVIHSASIFHLQWKNYIALFGNLLNKLSSCFFVLMALSGQDIPNGRKKSLWLIYILIYNYGSCPSILYAISFFMKNSFFVFCSTNFFFLGFVFRYSSDESLCTQTALHSISTF